MVNAFPFSQIRLADEVTRIRASLAEAMGWVYVSYTADQLELIAGYLR